jgi:hypothetical protein
MSDKDKTSSQGQIPEAQFIAAIQAQQDRISMLEGELTKLIQTQRASVNDKIQGLKPPKPDTFDGRQVDTFLYQDRHVL